MNKVTKDKRIVVVLSILVIALLIGVGVLTFFFVKEKFGNKSGNFDIDGLDPSIANKLSGSIVYSTDTSDDATYFSSGLDITFKYNSNLLTVTEMSNAVSISPKNWDLFSGGYLRIVKTTDIKGLFLMDTMYDDIKLSKEEDGDGFKKLLFEYSETSLIDSSKSTTKYLTVLYKQIEDQKSAYIQVPDFNYSNEEELTTALGNILKTISTDTSDVETDIEVKLADDIVSVKFDRNLWALSYQTNTSLSIMGVDDNEGSISIYTSPVYSADEVKDKAAIKAQVEEKIEYKRGYFDDNKLTFKTVGEIADAVISGITFQKASYQYDYGTDITYRESVYVGYLPGIQQQVEITTQSYGNNYKEVEKNLQKVMENTVIKDKELYSMNIDNVLGASTVSINIASVLGQASTTHIYSKECNSVSFSRDLTGLRVAGKTYDICSVGFGSGFVVNGSSEIVSNAHVVDPNDFDAVVNGFSNDGVWESNISQDFGMLLASQYGIQAISSMTEDQVTYYLLSFLDALYTKEYMTITPKNRELYVQGNEIFDIDMNTGDLRNSSQHYKAELVSSNKITSSISAGLSEDPAVTNIADLGIIRLLTSVKFPSIPLDSAEALVGDTIYVVGYPGVADNSSLVNTKAVLSSTVTKGTVSAIKPSTSSAFNLVQIDASIDHGNSGGPIINEVGEVVGVATYGMVGSGSGNYNAGISIDGVKTFLTESSISASSNDERESLESALTDVSKEYYSRAKEKLVALVSGNGNLNLTLNPYIELCDSKIAAGEDKTPWIDFGIDIPNWGLLLIGGVIVLFIASGILLIIFVKKGKKSGDNSNDEQVQGETTSAPMESSTPVTQSQEPTTPVMPPQESISPVMQPQEQVSIPVQVAQPDVIQPSTEGVVQAESQPIPPGV